MWEEDPRWQEANYRLLVGGTAGLTLLATAYGLIFREWHFLAVWFSVLGVLVGALCLYAAVICSVVYGIRSVAKQLFWKPVYELVGI
jgi:hypothetical protein